MLLIENISLRVREWLDREDDEPDLVPRLKRLWAEAPVRVAQPAPRPLTIRSASRLPHRPALGTGSGL